MIRHECVPLAIVATLMYTCVSAQDPDDLFVDVMESFSRESRVPVDELYRVCARVSLQQSTSATWWVLRCCCTDQEAEEIERQYAVLAESFNEVPKVRVGCRVLREPIVVVMCVVVFLYANMCCRCRV